MDIRIKWTVKEEKILPNTSKKGLISNEITVSNGMQWHGKYFHSNKISTGKVQMQQIMSIIMSIETSDAL